MLCCNAKLSNKAGKASGKEVIRRRIKKNDHVALRRQLKGAVVADRTVESAMPSIKVLLWPAKIKPK
jgi:hypothetical protein